VDRSSALAKTETASGITSSEHGRTVANVDRHVQWRLVANNVRALREKAPDGYEVVVEVYLAGRAEPVILDHVETSRNADNPWTFLESAAPGAHEKPLPGDFWVFVHENHIERIEIRFARTDSSPAATFGFGQYDETIEP
jgi:hypothetical protein